MQRKLAGWKFALLDLVAPPECAGCGVLGVPFCENCLAKTHLFQNEICRICGAPIHLETLCPACSLLPPAFAGARSFAEYAAPFRGVVLAMKYQGDPSLGHFIAHCAIRSLRQESWSIDIGVPVPLGKARYRKRGYNQVDLFAEPLCREMNLPFEPEALSRIQETRSQVGLSTLERRYNLRKAFQADSKSISGKNVLLFDDVFTSGATANECSIALLDAGAKNVYVFTLARALGSADQEINTPFKKSDGG